MHRVVADGVLLSTGGQRCVVMRRQGRIQDDAHLRAVGDANKPPHYGW